MVTVNEGLYRVSFATQFGQGSGVVVLKDGKILGGDSMMAYSGDYSVSSDKLNASIKVRPHTNQPGMTSVLGVNNADLNLVGKVAANTIDCRGSTPQAPGVTFEAKLQLLQAA